MNPRLSIRDQLSEAGRGRDRAVRLATLLTLMGLLLLLFLGVALLDYGLILPASIRWAALAVLGVAAMIGGIRLIRLWRRSTSLKQSALEVEAARPDVGCEVSTAAEYLTGERKVSQEFEQELVTALQQRAAATVTQSPLPHAEIFAACRAGLEGNFVPTYLQVVDEIPKTASEKPQERFLLERFAPDAKNVYVER